MINGIIDSGQKIVTNGLVLHLDAAQLRSYPGSGTTWTDLSGNSNNGTLTNGPTFNSGNGGSIVFDGVNDYVNINNSTTLNIGTNSSTVSVWIKLNVVAGRIIWKRLGGIGNGYSLFLSSAKFSFEVLTATDSRTMVCANTTLQNVIYNVTAVFNRDTTSYMYVNGVQDANLDITIFSGVNITNTINYRLANDTNVTGSMNGNLYAIYHYNRGLTATEVLQNFNAIKSRYGL
jgi:hypothetical protein